MNCQHCGHEIPDKFIFSEARRGIKVMVCPKCYRVQDCPQAEPIDIDEEIKRKGGCERCE